MVPKDGEGSASGTTRLLTARELEEALVRRTFWFLASFCILVLVPVKLAWWLRGGNVVGVLGLLELVTLGWSAWRVWRHREDAARFLAVGLVIVYAQAAALAWLQGGLQAPALRWLSVLPIITIVAGNLRLGLLLCGAFVVQVVVMAAYPPGYLWLLRPLVMPNPFVQTLVSTAGSVMLLSIFGLIAIRWRRQVHRVLEAAHQQAQRGNEAKQRFLAIMSHEIRTPLNGIVGTVSMLGQRNLAPQEQQQLLQLLSNSSDMLVSLLSDVLDWAKLEAGHVDVTRGPVRLRALLVDSVEMFASVAFDKGLELTYSHEAGLPEVLMGDEMHLRQALNNLVSNAVKFTRQGGVHVHMGTEVAEDALPEPGGARVHVRIEVQDSGIGMTTAQLSGLFQPFAQVDQSTTRQYGGTGLGLSISRELARRMGGDIVVSSRPGVGSCFVIRVPLGAEGVPEPLGGQALPSGLAGRRLCLVSRSAGLRRQVGALAHDLGLVLAPDGAPPAEADAVLVDAAVLQARADDADGMASVAPWSWGASGQSRAVLSAIAQAHDLDLPPGVLHLYQPLRASALADWLTGTSWLGATQDLPASSASDEALPELHVLVAEDHELNRMLLGEMLEHCQAHVELVETGRAAVEAVKARHFDLLLVDYQMPGMDGLSAARLIRQHERAQGLEPMPIVLISGDVNVEAQGVWQEAGVNRVLGKPFVFGDMVALIDEVRRALPPRSVQAQ